MILLLAAPGAPAALPGYGSVEQSQEFTRTWLSRSPSISTCVTYTLTGTVRFKATHVPEQTSYPSTYEAWMVSEVRLDNPTLTARAYVYDDRTGCTDTPQELTSFSMEQLWAGNTCSMNPQISVGLPWTVAFGFWPNCESRDQAVQSSSYGPGSVFDQANDNDGSPSVTWPGTLVYGVRTKPENPCLAAYVTSHAYLGTSSDSYGGKQTSQQSVCLDVQYS